MGSIFSVLGTFTYTSLLRHPKVFHMYYLSKKKEELVLY